MDAKEFRQFAKATVDYIADYLENIRDRQVLPSVEPGYLQDLIPKEAPHTPEKWQEILADLERVIMPGVTHWHSPQFHAYYPTANSYPGIVGEMMSAAIGCIGFSWAHIDSLVTKSHQFQSALHRATRPTWGLSPDILRTIYHGAFEPLILYCVSAFQNILHKKWVQNKLIQIQRGFILRITKAYRTTSTDAALVIAGIPPLFLTAMAKAEISNVKRNGIFIEQESYLEVEKRSHFQLTGHPKDFHRASNTCTDRHEYNIYTDGSRLQKENDVTLVGCAFVTYYNTTEVHSATFRLAPMCSVFQAELFAILQAVKWSITNGIDSCIHSDSQSALQTIDDKYNLHSIAVEIRSLILKFEGRICLMWVRGHTGTEGNERADTLAKQAASTNSEYKYSTCPISYIKQKIKHTTTLKWNTYWNSSVKGSVTKKLFFPNVQDRLCCSQFSTTSFTPNL
ncbi:hypothetical protein ANN_05132 [Periplaneta americana]|uniref:RNase H type-1 domain-containing protein n=1 Tax=Periplaneta americana TaxID=6978 RepID=A0ABQ8TC12_PERAM|nr:hypothetical protein ANN_05132 [Periplaneta americana]